MSLKTDRTDEGVSDLVRSRTTFHLSDTSSLHAGSFADLSRILKLWTLLHQPSWDQRWTVGAEVTSVQRESESLAKTNTDATNIESSLPQIPEHLAEALSDDVAAWIKRSGLVTDVSRVLRRLYTAFDHAPITLSLSSGVDDSTQLLVWVLCRGDVDSCLDTLDELDQNWWIAQPYELRNRVTILLR